MSDIYLPPTGGVLPEDMVLDEAGDTELPANFYGAAYEFDFDTGDFVVDVGTGKVALIEGPDAVLQGIEKALATERYAFLAYGPSYGNDAAVEMRYGTVGATAADLVLSHSASLIAADPRIADSVDLDVEVDPGAETIRVFGVLLDTYSTELELDVTFSYTP